jgi:hypothetical protein
MVAVGLSILVDVVARHLPVPLVIASITRASTCSFSVSYAKKRNKCKTKGSGSFNPKVLAVWVACHDETGTEPGRRKLNARKPRRRKLNALLPSVRASRPSRTGRKVSGTNGTYLSARSCFFVIPAKAGIQCLRPFASRRRHWIPAFAGMTSLSKCHSCQGQFVTTVWGLIRLGV